MDDPDDTRTDDAGNFVETVYTRNDPRLREAFVSFHWWDSMRTSLHRHDHYEIFIITSGRTWHILNGARTEQCRGALFLLRPQDCHQFLPIGGTRCVHINLAVTEPKLRELCGALGLSLEALTAGEGPVSVALREGELERFLDSAERLNCIGRAGDPARLRAPIICGMICQALLLLAQRESRENCPEWFEALLRRLGAPENIGCSAGDVYAMCGFSAPVVIRYFRRYTGMGVSEYLRGVRIDCACELLRGTRLTALEISGRLGYDSLSHFNRIFKEHTGMTPREYKNSDRV